MSVVNLIPVFLILILFVLQWTEIFELFQAFRCQWLIDFKHCKRRHIQTQLSSKVFFDITKKCAFKTANVSGSFFHQILQMTAGNRETSNVVSQRLPSIHLSGTRKSTLFQFSVCAALKLNWFRRKGELFCVLEFFFYFERGKSNYFPF